MSTQGKNAIYRMWILVFMVSFFVGILFMNSCSGWFLHEEGIFNQASVNRLKYIEVDYGAFLPYVFKQRMKGFLLLGIISTTCFGIAATYFCITWQGILTGMMLTAVFIRFGIKGILLILAGIFPQQLLFIPAGIMMLCWCYQNCSFLYYPSKYIWPKFHNKKQQYIRQGLTLLWILGIVVIGCILECYVNPMLITDIIKIF